MDGAEVAATGEGLEGEVFAIVNPRDIVLSREAPAGSAQNVFSGAVEEWRRAAERQRLRVVVASRPRLVAKVTRAGGRIHGSASRSDGVPSHRSEDVSPGVSAARRPPRT